MVSSITSDIGQLTNINNRKTAKSELLRKINFIGKQKESEDADIEKIAKETLDAIAQYKKNQANGHQLDPEQLSADDSRFDKSA